MEAWGSERLDGKIPRVCDRKSPQTNEIRICVIDTVLNDGTVLVKDGILLSIGKPSYWGYKCRSAMS